MSINDLQSPLSQDMNRRDPESRNIQREYEQEVEIRRARNITKCFRFFASIVIVGFIVWIVSLIVRNKYKTEKPKDLKTPETPESLILRSLLYTNFDTLTNEISFGNFKLTGNAYIKYFSRSGENPMHCTGSYCWPWQTPNKVVCSIKNNAKPWDSDASWMCEAMCPDDYDLDTVRITCSQDPSIATNPHLGCNLVYSMQYNSFISEIDWENVGFFTAVLFLSFACLLILMICASTSPSGSYSSYSSSYSRNSGPDACDILICLTLINVCSSSGRHSSRTWG